MTTDLITRLADALETAASGFKAINRRCDEGYFVRVSSSEILPNLTLAAAEARAWLEREKGDGK